MRNVYVSTLALGRLGVQAMRQAGGLPDQAKLELGGGIGREDALWLLDQARQTASDGTPGQFLLHNYFPPPEIPFVINLASADQTIRQRTIDFCRASMENCAAIGSPYYSVHAGMAVDPSPDQLGRAIDPANCRKLGEAMELFRDSVRQLVPDAQRLGVRLLLENHVLARFNAPDGINRMLLLCGAEDFEAFDTDFPWDEVGILLDVGHLKVTSTTLGFDAFDAVRVAHERIGAVHLHDNDGVSDLHRAFDGTAWFLPLLAELPQSTDFIVESGPATAQSIELMCKVAVNVR